MIFIFKFIDLFFCNVRYYIIIFNEIILMDIIQTLKLFFLHKISKFLNIYVLLILFHFHTSHGKGESYY